MNESTIRPTYFRLLLLGFFLLVVFIVTIRLFDLLCGH
jgi:hypothetical protein